MPSAASYFEDRVFGWNPEAGRIFAVACSYFLWDTLDAIINFIDSGFITELLAFSSSWASFLDKLGRTGSRAQAIHRFFLLNSIFFVRLIYGDYVSYHFLKMLHKVHDQISLAYIHHGLELVMWSCKVLVLLFKQLFESYGNIHILPVMGGKLVVLGLLGPSAAFIVEMSRP